MIRDMFGNTIEKDSIVAFALTTGNLVLAKVDYVPNGIYGEPPAVLISPNQIALPVSQNGIVGGVMSVKIEDPKSNLVVE